MCHLNIERGNQKSLGKFLTLDETKLAELTEDECNKYLGQDENIGYNDVLNKERVIKEYMKRIRKIWSSELYSNNKIIDHNTFAIPVLTPTFGIIKWTKDELEQMDVKTRKISSVIFMLVVIQIDYTLNVTKVEEVLIVLLYTLQELFQLVDT